MNDVPASRRHLLGDPIICLVTDGRASVDVVSAGLDSWVERLVDAASAGVTLLQVREPDVSGRLLFTMVQRLVTAAAGLATRVVVSDRLDVALAGGAHGVHLKSTSAGAHDVRALAPKDFLVGRSVHGLEEALEAEARGADYVVFGSVFATRSKPSGSPVAGLGALRAVARKTTLPVIAIGGMTIERAAGVAQAGASGVAGIGMFLGPRTPADAAVGQVKDVVSALRRAFGQAPMPRAASDHAGPKSARRDGVKGER